MGGITFVAISVVSLVHLATADTVRANEKLYLKRAIMAAAGEEVPREAGAVEAWYGKNITPVLAGDAEDEPSVFRVRTQDAEDVAGTVYIRQGAGLWGTITAVIGIEPDGKTVSGVDFVAHNETPGLGARISEPWFEGQFDGRAGPFRLVPEGTRSEVPQEIDAITGATITSKAVRDIFNRTLTEIGNESNRSQASRGAGR
jgi:Na+-transporting NADH:ubiquinone oxidoreductase subunit C